MKRSSIAGAAVAALLSVVSIGGSLQAVQASGTPPAQTWLSPPPGYFALPPRVVGRTWPAPDGSTFVQPLGMDRRSTGSYSADFYRSAAYARSIDQRNQAGARAGALGEGTGWGAMPPPLFAAHPAGGWVYGVYWPRTGLYAYTAGATFHNLVLRVVADCHLPRGGQPDACQEWTVGTLELLLGRAHLYAAAHPGGDRV